MVGGVISDQVMREGLCEKMALTPRLRAWEGPIHAGEEHCELLQGGKSTSVFCRKPGVGGMEWLVSKGLR